VQGLSHVEVIWERPGSHHALTIVASEALEFSSPVLEPDLYLSGAESWNLSGESLPMGGVGMGLSCKLAHEEPRLIVGKPESLHLSLLGTDLSGGHRWLVLVLLWRFFHHVVPLLGDDLVALDFDIFSVRGIVR
jgi:hypothetical protein